MTWFEFYFCVVRLHRHTRLLYCGL